MPENQTISKSNQKKIRNGNLGEHDSQKKKAVMYQRDEKMATRPKDLEDEGREEWHCG